MQSALIFMRISMPNILVTGSNGQLGSELRDLHVNFPEYTFLFTDRNTLNITDKEAIQSTCKSHSITHIINCAAYTAVDKAEEQQQQADSINHIAVQYLAEIAKELNIALIHISTDYVFDGKNYRPYREDDITNPQGVYGKTKLNGEKALQHVNPKNSIIIRTSWVYSRFGNNFVKTMLRLGEERDNLGIIFDQVGTPTYAKDLAQHILEIVSQVDNQDVQLFHYSNEGVCSWYDFANVIFELSNTACNTTPIESSQYPTPAKRPHFSILNKVKIKKEYNIEISYWKDSLKLCLTELKEKTQ